ncbi:MAG: efflux transporter outer membrane subunit [Candidatus Aminicenantes bacterium]|nr:MAG: efflux transporter outer membrane subunit [Candidatus Aminicenantes bacterium]
MKKIVFLLALTFISLSCVSKLREPPEIDLDVPDKWVSGELKTEGNISRWWIRFDDPELNSIISVVLKENYNLKASGARLEAAAALARIAGANLYPQSNLNLNAIRQKRNFLGFPFPGSDVGVPSVITNLFGVSLDVSWEVDLWGRIRALKSAATADFQASRADLAGFQLSLAGQTAKAWFAAIEAEQQVRLAEATVENYRTTNEQVFTRYRRGLRPSLDVRFSEANLAAAEAVLLQRQNQLQRIKRQLEILVGRYPAGRISLSDKLPEILDPIPAGLPADLISRRPDLIAAEKRLAAANLRVAESRRALYPRISLTGSAGTSSDELSNLLNGDYSVWNLIGNLFQPIFQGGRLRAGINLAKARERETLAIYGQAVLNAYSEVETALAAEKLLEETEKVLQIAVEQAVAARRLAEDRYSRGLTNLIEVLEAQRRAFDSQSQLLSLRRQKLENRIDLFLALGGDFHINKSTQSPIEKEAIIR